MQPSHAVLTALKDVGLLLTQDKALPDVVSIVTGEVLHTSWWGHPRAQTVFEVLSGLADHKDVLLTKLLFGKDTLVHRRLWPALLAVGSAREEWQLKGLASGSRQLLKKVDDSPQPVRATGTHAKPLLARLLVASREVHTESGAHAMALESWAAWSDRVGCNRKMSATAGQRQLEEVAREMGAPLKALPWHVRQSAT